METYIYCDQTIIVDPTSSQYSDILVNGEWYGSAHPSLVKQELKVIFGRIDQNRDPIRVLSPLNLTEEELFKSLQSS